MTTTRGATEPDSRGRTGLDRVGRDLDRNPDVVVRDVEVTSDGWHVLRRTTFDVRGRDGSWTTQQRETYDRGNGAAVLTLDSMQGVTAEDAAAGATYLSIMEANLNVLKQALA